MTRPVPAVPSKFQNVLYCPMSERGAASATRRIVEVMGDESSLVVAGVVPEPTRLQSFIHGSGHVAAALAEGRRHARRLVERCAAVASAADTGVSARAVVEVGHLALSLMTRAIASRHDLVALSFEDETDRTLIRRLLRKSPCPVWVIRPSRSTRERIVAAIDVDSGDEQLNASIVRCAEILAGEAGDLHLVSAWELYGESTMRSSAFVHVDEDELSAMRSEVRRAHEDAAAAIVANHAADPTRWSIHVEHGAASSVIRRAIERWHITTLAIGTVARTGVAGLVMGNTAEHVVETVGCSVLAVQPPAADV